MREISLSVLVIPAIASATTYLAYLSWRIIDSTSATAGRLATPTTADTAVSASSPKEPFSLPDDIKSSDQAKWVVSYERVVSKPIRVSTAAVSQTTEQTSPADKPPCSLLQEYARATHIVFATTPQARIMRLAISDKHTKQTFDAPWIQTLTFKDGDVVNGAYKVTYHGRGAEPASERVELTIEAPPSYRGPPAPKGLILAEVQHIEGDDKKHECVVFVNETWMWRREEEKPTLIESPLGGWFHGFMARWLVLRATESVVRRI